MAITGGGQFTGVRAPQASRPLSNIPTVKPPGLATINHGGMFGGGGGALSGTRLPGRLAGSKPLTIGQPHITNQPAQLPSGTPGAPTVNGGAGTGGGAGSGTTAPAPYDSTYYIDLARATQDAQDKIAGYQANISQGGVNVNNANEQLAQQQIQQTANAQNTENARGGFALGHLGQTTGQIALASQDAQSANSLRYQQDSDNWNRAIAGVSQGLSTEQIALALASADRLAAINAASAGTVGGGPAAGSGAPGAPPAAAPAASAPGTRFRATPVATKPSQMTAIRNIFATNPPAHGMGTGRGSVRVIPKSKGR